MVQTPLCIPEGYTKCICNHTEDESLDLFKTCPLYWGLDTRTDWNPAHIISKHAGWPTGILSAQKPTTILRQAEELDAVRRGLVRTAVYTLLRTHADDPKATAAHIERTAVTQTATQLPYRTHM